MKMFPLLWRQLGNPFDSRDELVVLYTQEVIGNGVVALITQIDNLVKDLHAKFMTQKIASYKRIRENFLVSQTNPFDSGDELVGLHTQEVI